MHPQSSDTEQKPKAPLGAEKGRVEWSIPHRSNHHYPISFQKIFIFSETPLVHPLALVLSHIPKYN